LPSSSPQSHATALLPTAFSDLYCLWPTYLHAIDAAYIPNPTVKYDYR